jgi:hypothetical protein
MKRLSCCAFLLLLSATVPLYSDVSSETRWLIEHQRYDLVLNPATIREMTDYAFVTYTRDGVERLEISDRRDGFWRVEPDLVLFQSMPPGPGQRELPGDQHTLSFNQVKNVLIENLDIYAHNVEEALKFSSCTNVVVRNCRLIASRNSEDAIDIVRGQNYIFDSVWAIGLGDREMSIKGSVRFVDIIDSRFGLDTEEDFSAVFRISPVTIGIQIYQPGDQLLPRETIPDWIRACLLFNGDRSLGIEIGGWSNYDIGYINEEGELEMRPSTQDIRVDARFTHPMEDSCDRAADHVAILQWHTAERVTGPDWIFKPTETDVFGDLVEDLYYEESEPSPEREAELREELGLELDYYGVELPRYAIAPGEYSNNRFFGKLYNFDNQFIYSPEVDWLYIPRSGLLEHDFLQPGTWVYHYNTASWYLYLGGNILPAATWWGASDGNWYYGAFVAY